MSLSTQTHSTYLNSKANSFHQYVAVTLRAFFIVTHKHKGDNLDKLDLLLLTTSAKKSSNLITTHTIYTLSHEVGIILLSDTFLFYSYYKGSLWFHFIFTVICLDESDQ